MALRAIAAEKRQHIVATAYALFKKHGFHATGIDRIIAEAKVAKMTMYRHFPSKDGLIVEVLDWRSERFARQLDAFEKVGKAPHQTIAAIFDWAACSSTPWPSSATMGTRYSRLLPGKRTL
jgi:AcrR family transcriptional regulator